MSHRLGLLDESTAGEYAVERGVIPPGETSSEVLAGGVSNIVLLVRSRELRVVVKQALPRLRVADEWRADPGRAQVEAAALRMFAAFTPGQVPEVLDDDAEEHALIVSAAPSGWVGWKEHLLRGEVDQEIPRKLGNLLRVWHTRTSSLEPGSVFDRTDLFEQLRLKPYFGTAAARRPRHAESLRQLAEQVGRRRVCVISGDFSPKNVLVGDGSLWLIDLEVACYGDPAFDVAFMLTHLTAKAWHMPRSGDQLADAARNFLTTYADGPGVSDEQHTSSVLAGLLIARVAGSSPLEYLAVSAAHEMENAAGELLAHPATSMREALARVWPR